MTLRTRLSILVTNTYKASTVFPKIEIHNKIIISIEFVFTTEVNILHCAVSSLAIERKSKSRRLSSTPGKRQVKLDSDTN